MQADRVLAQARNAIGTPFRIHGRNVETGLDCVGLVALATQHVRNLPIGYTLRNSDEQRWLALLDAHGIRRAGQIEPGDVLLLQAGPAQFHLGIWSGSGLIHADARARRVVERPGPLPWPMIGAWQFTRE